jgi:hypothetical protein
MYKNTLKKSIYTKTFLEKKVIGPWRGARQIAN